MKKVLFDNKEYGQIIIQLNKLMEDAENMSDVDNKVLFYQVLQYFDSLHREPLSRIMEALKDNPDIKAELVNDPTISKMLSLYDLIDNTEGHRKQDDASSLAFIPEDQVQLMTIPKKKDWLELGDVDTFEHNKMYPKNYQKVNFIISRIGKEVFAVQNQCDGSFLPIDKGIVEDYFVTCPWHGCKYDLRTGLSVDQSNKKIETYPVEILEDGLLRVEISYELN